MDAPHLISPSITLRRATPVNPAWMAVLLSYSNVRPSPDELAEQVHKKCRIGDNQVSSTY